MSDEIVIIQHPLMYDQYVVAKMIDHTLKTVSVVYWNNRKDVWMDEPKRRKIDCVIKRLGSVSDEEVKKLSNQLISFAAERDRRIKDARLWYYRNMRGDQQ